MLHSLPSGTASGCSRSRRVCPNLRWCDDEGILEWDEGVGDVGGGK